MILHLLSNFGSMTASRMADRWQKALLLRELLRFHIRGHGQAWRIFTHLTPFERLLLYRFGSRRSPGSTFLEVGSYLGASACFLASAADEIGGGAKVHCVDTWHNDGMSEGDRDTWEQFNSNTRRYRALIIPHRGKSLDIAPSFCERIDLLFLDGDHAYDACQADVRAWLPLLKQGGLVLLHDYAWSEGVRKVVHEHLSPFARKEGCLPNLYWAWF